jgi:hypothetical protein
VLPKLVKNRFHPIFYVLIRTYVVEETLIWYDSDRAVVTHQHSGVAMVEVAEYTT